MTRTLLVARHELRLLRRDPYPLFVLIGMRGVLLFFVTDAYRSVLTGEQGFSRAIAMLLGLGALFTAVTLWAFRAEKPKDSYLGE